MPIVQIQIIRQPVAQDSINNTFVRIGNTSAGIPGINVLCTEPIPSEVEITNVLMPILRFLIPDGYREKKSKSKKTQSKIIVDQRQKIVVPPTIDPVPIIKLGGAFQEIGGDNENAGGGYQKLG